MSEANEVDGVVMRCYTCKHWKGDKRKALKMASENPISMDVDNGWPGSAPCDYDSKFIEIIVHGDGWAEREFNANFGCIYWCASYLQACRDNPDALVRVCR